LVDPAALRLGSAALLVAFALYKFRRPRSHPRWVGMRVTPRDLVVWSFLMSSAHGAGLMLVPVLLGLPVAEHAHDIPQLSNALVDAAGALVHTLAMLTTMAAVALVVYEKV